MKRPILTLIGSLALALPVTSHAESTNVNNSLDGNSSISIAKRAGVILGGLFLGVVALSQILPPGHHQVEKHKPKA